MLFDFLNEDEKAIEIIENLFDNIKEEELDEVYIANLAIDTLKNTSSKQFPNVESVVKFFHDSWKLELKYNYNDVFLYHIIMI